MTRRRHDRLPCVTHRVSACTICPPRPEDAETFTYGPYTWDVDHAWRLATEDPTTVPVDSLTPLLATIAVDLDHVATVDVDRPILLGWWPDLPAGMPLDGWHRVMRAVQLDLRVLPCVWLTPEQSAAALVSDLTQEQP